MHWPASGQVLPRLGGDVFHIKQNISFSEIRNIAGTDYGVWSELGRGRSILSSENQLDQYLYSYGPMIQSQWDFILENMIFPECTVQLIDYACGQGLASVLLHDRFLDSDLARILNVNLIEPSLFALNRAGHIVKCCYPNAGINCINKLLDEVEENDILITNEGVKIHLFSNVLDIEGFNQYQLLSKVFTKSGQHWIIAVSHDRDHNGGSYRLQQTYEKLIEESLRNCVKIIDNNIIKFEYKNSKSAIAFLIKIEI